MQIDQDDQQVEENQEDSQDVIFDTFIVERDGSLGQLIESREVSPVADTSTGSTGSQSGGLRSSSTNRSSPREASTSRANQSQPANTASTGARTPKSELKKKLEKDIVFKAPLGPKASTPCKYTVET